MASRAERGATPRLIARTGPGESAPLLALLQFESGLRRAASLPELFYYLANETQRIVACEQIVVLRQTRVGSAFRIAAVSGIAVIDPNAPFVRAVEAIVARLRSAPDFDKAQSLDRTAYGDPDDAVMAAQPFPEWYWQPFKDVAGGVFGGLIVTRNDPLHDGEALRLDRVAETSGHAWRALAGGQAVKRLPMPTRRQRRVAAFALALVALVPIRISALAPAEVIAARPFVVTAPFAGVVAAIDAPPNAPVRAGQVLLRFEDTKLRNELTLSGERLEVSRARLERASSGAFGAQESAREVAIMRAEFDLARAENAYARDMLAKSTVVAPRDGVVVYTDRREWEGRAVATGEAILQVADPRAVALRIDLPAREQLELRTGSAVKLWLDSQPLWAIDARLDQVSYQARQTPEGVLAFAVRATPIDATPRIGSRGTARLEGSRAPLIYVVLRRPIGAVRQYLGL